MRWFGGKTTINKIIKTMIYSDFLLISAGGLLTPIYAIFVTKQIAGATIAVVGFTTTIFWVSKSLAQFPISWIADKIKGERDDYVFLVVGSLLASAVPLFYYFLVSQVWHVYLLESFNGLASAMMVPAWLAIYGRHIDKGRENTEWMLHSNAVGLGYAVAASVGGLMAQQFGFRIIFLLVSAMMFLGTAVLVIIKQEIIDSDYRNGFRVAEAHKIKDFIQH